MAEARRKLTRRRRESAWRTGPPKWTFTAYGVALATVHLVFAAGDWRRAFDLWREAWPFYASLVGITSAAAVVIHRRGRAAAGLEAGGLLGNDDDTGGDVDETIAGSWGGVGNGQRRAGDGAGDDLPRPSGG